MNIRIYPEVNGMPLLHIVQFNFNHFSAKWLQFFYAMVESYLVFETFLFFGMSHISLMWKLLRFCQLSKFVVLLRPFLFLINSFRKLQLTRPKQWHGLCDKLFEISINMSWNVSHEICVRRLFIFSFSRLQDHLHKLC